MRVIKAFATHSRFINNANNIEHVFGELSTDARTFAKDIAMYPHPQDSSIMLNVFNSTDNNVRKAPVQGDLNLCFEVIKYVYEYILRSPRAIYVDELNRELLEQFRTKAHSFGLGNVVTDNTYSCVQWVKWRDNNNNEFLIWLSDKSFKAEYDDYEIEIIPPVDNIDIFHTTKSQVEAELAKMPVDLLTKKANARKGTTPVTVFRLDIFQWHNPISKKAELPTYWYILIWGDAGDNIDAVREKIQDTILKASSHNRDKWKAIFPEIFRRNEFILVPQWDIFSNENKVKHQASLYSPFMEYDKMISKYGKPFMNEIPESFIKLYGQSASLYYRSICAFMCGSPENLGDVYKVSQLFPDFLDVPSTSTDFNYQSPNTQEWSLKLQSMLNIAETMTPTSTLPRQTIRLPSGESIPGDKLYTKVIRDGKLFLVMRHQNYHFLVAAKYNFNPSI